MIETIMAVTSHIRASIGVSERIIAKLQESREEYMQDRDMPLVVSAMAQLEGEAEGEEK